MKLVMKVFRTVFLFIFLAFCNQIYCQNSGFLEKYDLTGAKVTKIELPDYLEEVSGLATFGSKHLLMHNDEEGIIFIYDLTSKKIVRKVKIGDKKIKEDFEGIAVKGDTVFLSTSNGKIYSVLLKDKSEAEVIYVEKMKTNDKINLEGLCYNEDFNTLILPNKIEVDKKHRDERKIYSFDIAKKKFSKESLIKVSLDELNKKYKIDNFSPTAIEIHPLNKNIFILSSHEKCIIELNPEGRIINAAKLDEKNHRQPEGLTFLSNLSMVISNEASGKKAELTIIPFEK